MTTDRAKRYAANRIWIEVKDGNTTARAIFCRHYSYNQKREQLSLFPTGKSRNYLLFVGPGQKTVLLAGGDKALFVWRKFRSMNHQEGVNCAVFRNEGAGLSSDLIQEADRVAWERWPGERLYTYVNAGRVKSRNPGYCFIKAGWRRCGVTKSGLVILECLSGVATNDYRSRQTLRCKPEPTDHCQSAGFRHRQE